jgi:hypothetical protein
MRAKSWLSLILLCCACADVSAQSTGLQTLTGYRHDGPGRVVPSSSTFALGMTRDNGATYTSTASVNDTVTIRGEVRPEPANVGQTADIFVVDRLLGTNEFRMRTQDGVWVPWNVTVATLVPFREDVPLTSALPVDMFTGTLGTAGEHRLFLGYMAPDGILRYHTSGLPLSISAQTQSAREQAFNQFASSISPEIVATRCITCHVNGGSAPSVGAYALRQPPETNLSANFDIFNNLVDTRGANFVLSKATGGNEHSGGVQIVAGSAEAQRFAAFLNLLTQD